MQLNNLFRTTTFRVAIAYLGIFTISVVMLLGSIYYNTTGFMERQTDATIDAEIIGLAEQYRQRKLNGIVQVIVERSRNSKESLYLLTRPNRQRLAGNLSGWPDAPTQPDGWIDFSYSANGEGGPESHAARARHFVLPGGFNLLVGRDVHERRQIENRVTKFLAFAVLLTGLVGITGAVLISRSVMNRIDAINVTSSDIMGGDLSQRVPVRGTGDELDELAENLNAMLDKMERLMAGMREVSDNIAHDLRSPLNRMRNRLEVTLIQAPDKEAYAAAIEKTIEETDDLLGTFNALLSIARAEAGTASDSMVEVDLGQVVADAIELYEPVAEEKLQTFDADLEEVPKIWGNREMIAQAIANLLDNAIKYTPAGGRVDVALKPGTPGAIDGRDAIRLTIRDTGPGIPGADRERVTDRFVRLERSRNTPGSGLGLSLVSAVARLHDARLTLSENDPEHHETGLRVVLIFPSKA